MSGDFTSFSDKEREELIAIISEAIRKSHENDANSEILIPQDVYTDIEKHRCHHKFVEELIERRRRRRELFAKFQGSLIGGITIAILGSLGAALMFIGKLVIEHIQRNPPGGSN